MIVEKADAYNADGTIKTGAAFLDALKKIMGDKLQEYRHPEEAIRDASFPQKINP